MYLQQSASERYARDDRDSLIVWRVGPFSSARARRRFVLSARETRNAVQRPLTAEQDLELQMYLSSARSVVARVARDASDERRFVRLVARRLRAIVVCKYNDDVVAPTEQSDVQIVYRARAIER